MAYALHSDKEEFRELWTSYCVSWNRTAVLAWKIGTVLCRIRAASNVGDWTPWLKQQEIDPNTAQRWMKVSREISEEDITQYKTFTEALKAIPLKAAQERQSPGDFGTETYQGNAEMEASFEGVFGADSKPVGPPVPIEEIDAESLVMEAEIDAEIQAEGVEKAHDREMQDARTEEVEPEYDPNLQQWVDYLDQMTRNERANRVRKYAQDLKSATNRLDYCEKQARKIQRALLDEMPYNTMLAKFFGISKK